jgi:hypothetical protein
VNPQEARDAGMALAENAADSRLVAIVDQVIAEFNASGREWSANDIRDRLPAVNPPVIGARVKAAMMRRPMEMRRVGVGDLGPRVHQEQTDRRIQRDHAPRDLV